MPAEENSIMPEHLMGAIDPAGFKGEYYILVEDYRCRYCERGPKNLGGCRCHLLESAWRETGGKRSN